MYKQLPHGVKIGITRSIVASFTEYMKSIEWNEEKFDMQQFVEQWKQYLYTKSRWLDQIDDEVKNHPDFHQELAMKVNEKMNRILNEYPTKEQLYELENLGFKNLGSLCKEQAQYYIEHLQMS
ncbi:hypothetical protein [Bacillus bingmayongensis]|uniref:Group-specific protein n=1 Tax=Bacillus bingmayongensis TaxID=1150157 RepID=A0ABU5JRN6_9BACI|nr:hypothetical protein [Bacillus bingmayongensis]MBY0597746.1 hypothetical protein [Bacillus bingmayongensis]MDZ5606098.1 hypothetical protein [Bacillus pseudomycoides]